MMKHLITISYFNVADAYNRVRDRYMQLIDVDDLARMNMPVNRSIPIDMLYSRFVFNLRNYTIDDIKKVINYGMEYASISDNGIPTFSASENSKAILFELMTKDGIERIIQFYIQFFSDKDKLDV